MLKDWKTLVDKDVGWIIMWKRLWWDVLAGLSIVNIGETQLGDMFR